MKAFAIRSVLYEQESERALIFALFGAIGQADGGLDQG